jgi:beta-N-acetylhexosaminidase
MMRKAFIIGLKGLKLTNNEILFLRKNKPWGVILFSRNIKNLHQLKKLIKSIKNIINDNKYPILIDQEGGRVSRLNSIIDLSVFSQNYFGNLFVKNKKLFFYTYKIYVDTVTDIMNEVGININTVPVLDVFRKKSHKIVGDRSFSSNPKIVSEVGNICINLYKKKSIATVLKHIPGHGLSKFDSHYKLDKITEKKKDLIKRDFKPFKNCKSFFAMTAHLIYKEYDEVLTATHSNIIIKEIIRKKIGFNGILISDDISMKSLKYGLENNATMALKAGCNLILHCNGNINEMCKLSKVIPKIDDFTQRKTSYFYKFLG